MVELLISQSQKLLLIVDLIESFTMQILIVYTLHGVGLLLRRLQGCLRHLGRLIINFVE